MKIKINDNEIYELNETKKKVICNDILEEEFEKDMIRRIRYALHHKYEMCYRRLYNEWCFDPDGKGSKLEKNGVGSIPTNPDVLAELIFKQPNYKSRSVRERENEAP